MNSYKWTKKETTGQIPAARDDHSICLDGDNLYLFGGFVSGVRHNDLYVYHFPTNKWEQLFAHHPYHEIEETKDFPVPWSGQAIGVAGDQVILFGGRNDFNDMLDDTWEFLITEKKWTWVQSPNQPIGWSSHTITVDGTRCILFGGIVDITKEINELHQFEFASKTWSQVDDNVEHEGGIEASPSPMKRRELATTVVTKTQTADESKDMKN